MSYELDAGSLESCKENLASCLKESFAPLSAHAAKEFAFYSKVFTPELYRRIFAEEPPARTRPA